MFDFIRKMLRPKPKRLDLKFVTYAEGDKLCRQGWQIAPEEDHNKIIGMVWLELLEHHK